MEININRTFRDRMAFIWRFAKPHKMTILSNEICNITRYIFDIFKPLILAAIIDEGFLHSNKTLFLQGILVYTVFFLGGALVSLLSSYTWLRILLKFVHDIRVKLFDNIMHAKAGYLSNLKTGDIIARINDNANELQFVLIRNILNTFNQVVSFVLTLYVLFSINVFLGLFNLVMIPLTTFLTTLLSKKVKEISRESATSQGILTSRIYEYMKGMREIRIFQAGKYIERQVIHGLAKLLRLDVKASVIELSVNKGNGFVNLIGNLGLFGLCTYLVFNGSLTVGLFLAAYQYFNTSQGNLNWMANNYVQWQKRKIYIDRAEEIITMATEKDDSREEVLTVPDGRLEFENVSFCYDQRQQVLEDISFTAEKGEKVAIVGASGAGKSTIASLMLGLYAPQSGRIMIDGMDISACTYKSLRRSLGVVQQDIQLFSNTIRYNLRIGSRKASDADMWNALHKAGIADYVENLPGQLDTVIGKNGVGLSGGQMQRLMIARIFLKDPKILIMDEATSSLDYESEQLIRESFESLSSGRTTLVIAHRLSTIFSCDKVVVIADGKVASIGKHADLLENSDSYRLLFEGQYLIKDKIEA
jgi:ABC-type multidrug transport system fused ATPase/permease subunit